jgi:jumonji domain-containing protein 2
MQDSHPAFSSSLTIIQVVPPPEWKSRSAEYSQRLEQLVIAGPIEQNIFGKSGVYECLHIQKKSMSFKEYKAKMGVFDRITQGLPADAVETMVTMKLL